MRSRKVSFVLTAILAGAFLFSSCNKKIEKIKKNEILSLPSLTVKNDTTMYSDSGKIQLIMSFPIMERYNNAEPPYSEFREGMKVVFYDGHPGPQGSVSSKYARYLDKKKLWELRDSVVVINQTSDRLETEQLFWDQEKDWIFTERFVRMTSEDQTITGSGFESDSHLNKRRIKNISGNIYLKGE
jgi:LPS export ABC transporter protein LptC